MSWSYKLQGDEDVKQAIRDIEKALAQEVLVEAAGAGIAVITAEVKSLAAKISSRLSADVEEQVRRTRGGKASASTGPRGKTFPIAAAMGLEYGAGLYGTRGQKYTIRTGDRRSLSFVVGGTRIVRRSVQHPGYQAQPYMRPAWDRKKKQAVESAAKVLEARLGKVGR